MAVKQHTCFLWDIYISGWSIIFSESTRPLANSYDVLLRELQSWVNTENKRVFFCSVFLKRYLWNNDGGEKRSYRIFQVLQPEAVASNTWQENPGYGLHWNSPVEI